MPSLGVQTSGRTQLLFPISKTISVNRIKVIVLEIRRTFQMYIFCKLKLQSDLTFSALARQLFDA